MSMPTGQRDQNTALKISRVLKYRREEKEQDRTHKLNMIKMMHVFQRRASRMLQQYKASTFIFLESTVNLS